MTLAYWIDPRDNRKPGSKGLTEVLEKDRGKAENWLKENWKAELGWSWKLIYWGPLGEAGARRLSAEAQLERVPAQEVEQEAKAFGLSLLNSQTHNKTG